MTIATIAARLSTAFAVLLLPAAAMAAETITAAVSPPSPVVGMTKVTIAGKASPGAKVVNRSTYPDGTFHIFTVKADAAGAYTDGPFVLQQLGTYHDELFDLAARTSTTISYSGTGDFKITADPPSATVRTGGQARFKITFASVGGFGGEITIPQLALLSAVPGAGVTWSAARLRIPPNGSATVVLTILTLIDTEPRTYQLAVQGSSGAVTRTVEPVIELTVTPPDPGTITAAFTPDQPVVGVTPVRLAGRATAGQRVIDTSTFPDGVAHDFVANVTGRGTYSYGPFKLRQLGTYHDRILDGATGAVTEISYQGVGDFSAAVDHASQSVARGEQARFQLMFKSLSGFAGAIRPAVPDLSRIPGASAEWSSPTVTVRPGDTIAAGLTLKTSADTPPGSYTITLQGANGAVTRAVPDVKLIVK